MDSPIYLGRGSVRDLTSSCATGAGVGLIVGAPGADETVVGGIALVAGGCLGGSEVAYLNVMYPGAGQALDAALNANDAREAIRRLGGGR